MSPQSKKRCIWESVYGKPNAYCQLFGADCERCPFAPHERNVSVVSNFREMPASYWLSREHLWLAPGPADTVLIGLDHFAAGALQHIRSIVFPGKDTRLIAGKTCVWLFDIFGSISLRTPISGTVVRLNRELIRRPNLVLKAPYGRGWLLEARTRANWRNSLMQGNAAKQFIRFSQDLFKDKVVTAQTAVRNSLPLAADGGTLAADTAVQVIPEKYFRLLAETIVQTRDKKY